MIETWPTGPRRNIWHDIALQCHDADALRQAYADLERTVHHITTAHFHHAYDAALRKTTATQEQPDKCEMCDDTGWVDDPGYHSKRCTRALGCPCHGVKPCRCTRGQQMIETQRRITQANR